MRRLSTLLALVAVTATIMVLVPTRAFASGSACGTLPLIHGSVCIHVDGSGDYVQDIHESLKLPAGEGVVGHWQIWTTDSTSSLKPNGQYMHNTPDQTFPGKDTATQYWSAIIHVNDYAYDNSFVCTRFWGKDLGGYIALGHACTGIQLIPINV